MQGNIVSVNPKCRKCNSYMVFPDMKDGKYIMRCSNCKQEVKPKWTFRRLLFWKS